MAEAEKEFQELFQEFFEEIITEGVAGEVKEAYEQLLEDNLRCQVEEVPGDMRQDLATSAAEVYSQQARDILNSSYLDHSDVGLAMATAFLDDSNQRELALKTRTVFNEYDGQFNGKKDRYENRTITVLTDPWPPQDLGTGVERFKDPEDDRTFY